MNPKGDRLLKLPYVLALTGLSRSTMYRMLKDGDFPRPVQLGKRAVAWRESDVIAWIDGRPPTSV